MKTGRILSIIILLSSMLLSGCWDSREINNIAVSICMGIDKSPDGYVFSQQILNSKAISAKRNTFESPVVIYSEEGKDIFELSRKITTHCPRRIFYSHVRMVVIGEELAKDGIQGIVDTLLRVHEFRTDFYFIVAKGTTAKNVLSVLTPLEIVPGIEMFDSLRTAEKSWAPVKSMRIIELANSIISEGRNPVLTGLEITSNNNNPSNSIDTLKQSSQTDRLKFTSLAALKKDKLVGWLDENESKGYNYILGNVKGTAGHIKIAGQDKVTFEVTREKSKINAYLLNGKPAINVDIFMETEIGGVEGQIDVSNQENIEKMIKIVESRITSFCNSALDRTKNELKTDIFGFGEVIHRSYPKQWEKIKDNWNNEFINLPIKVTVHTKINRLGQITKPVFPEGSD
ncbi:MAG: Ger(x)C family spore germination protein [Deltaproteobacteria bacterium]